MLIVAGLVEFHFRECVSLTCCRHAHRRIPDSSLDHNKTASSLGHSDNAESALPRRSDKVQSDRCPHSCVVHMSDHAHTGYHTRGGLQYDYTSPTVIPYSDTHTPYRIACKFRRFLIWRIGGLVRTNFLVNNIHVCTSVQATCI